MAKCKAITGSAMKGLTDTDIRNVFIAVNNLNTRGHSNKLMKQHCTIDATKFYFSNRVVNIWNSLSEHRVFASSVSAFKDRLFQFELVFDMVFTCNAWLLFFLFFLACVLLIVCHTCYLLFVLLLTVLEASWSVCRI